MTSITTKYTRLSEIPSFEFEGYIWISNSIEPIVLNYEKFDFSSISLNPFIVEGLLFNKTTGTSIHIQHAGDYLIHQYNLNEVKPENSVEKEYLPHRLKDVKKVCFKQLWEEEEDKNCEYFPVLTLKAIVFCGFKK